MPGPSPAAVPFCPCSVPSARQVHLLPLPVTWRCGMGHGVTQCNPNSGLGLSLLNCSSTGTCGGDHMHVPLPTQVHVPPVMILLRTAADHLLTQCRPNCWFNSSSQIPTLYQLYTCTSSTTAGGVVPHYQTTAPGPEPLCAFLVFNLRWSEPH